MPEMKRLIFGEGLMFPSLDGSKHFTIRKYREGAHDFKKGETVIAEFKDGLTILITITEDTKKASFKDLVRSKEEFGKHGGYYFDTEYYRTLRSYYPGMKWSDVGAVISYEILKVNGIPVVTLNEHVKR